MLAVVVRHTATPWDELCSSAGGGGGGGGGDASCGFAGFARTRTSQWTTSGRLVRIGGVLASRRRMMPDIMGMQARRDHAERGV